MEEGFEIAANFQVDVNIWRGTDPEQHIASWTSDSSVKALTDIPPVKRFFRVGTGFVRLKIS